jgi:hypothetical protein
MRADFQIVTLRHARFERAIPKFMGRSAVERSPPQISLRNCLFPHTIPVDDILVPAPDPASVLSGIGPHTRA